MDAPNPLEVGGPIDVIQKIKQEVNFLQDKQYEVAFDVFYTAPFPS
jgi:hypothetical protein